MCSASVGLVLSLGARSFGSCLTLEQLWQQYRGEANLHGAADVDNPFFYHSWFVRMYSYLYAFLPIAVVVAIAVSRAPAMLMTVVFVASFVAHSFGGFKGDRLILYTFPFFFTIWGVVLADLVPKLVHVSGSSSSESPRRAMRVADLGAIDGFRRDGRSPP
jgi:hypothetical protein